MSVHKVVKHIYKTATVLLARSAQRPLSRKQRDQCDVKESCVCTSFL